MTGSRLSDDEIMALKKDFPANGDSYRLLAMKNEVSGFEYIEQFILGNILGEILQMATMPLFTYVDDMVILQLMSVRIILLVRRLKEPCRNLQE